MGAGVAVQLSVPAEFTDCKGSRRFVFTVSKHSPVYKTLLRTFSQPPVFLLGSLCVLRAFPSSHLNSVHSTV